MSHSIEMLFDCLYQYPNEKQQQQQHVSLLKIQSVMHLGPTATAAASTICFLLGACDMKCRLDGSVFPDCLIKQTFSRAAAAAAAALEFLPSLSASSCK